MKLISTFIGAALLFSQSAAHSQMFFVYDQQSADESVISGSAVPIQTYQPLGQSFTPTLDSVGFIRLRMFDIVGGNGLGAILSVNLRSNSITGPIIGESESVILADGAGPYSDFIFSTPVSVAPGVSYYFQPVVQSGDGWAIIGYTYGYTGGTAFLQGMANVNNDLWFREGIVVPEPSTLALAVLGLGAGGWLVLKRRAKAPAR